MPTRQDDEMVLDWLSLRGDGHVSSAVAAHYGVTPERVRTATQRVVEADVACEGAHVEAAYPWRRK